MADRIGYGNFFEKKEPGVFGLNSVGTWGGAIGVLVCVAIAGRINNGWVTLGAVLTLVTFLVLYGWESDGKSLARRAGERRDWPRRSKAGETDYITGALSHLEGNDGGHPLPGILASTKLLRGIDGYGDPFDVIHYPTKGLFAVTFRCYPDGKGMEDQDLMDLMVARYGAWIATLSVEEGVVGASAIVDAAPGTGVDLVESVHGARVEYAPLLASQIMDDVIGVLPNHSSDITGYVTVVWKKAAMGTGTETAADVVVEIAKRLPSHMLSLSAGGAGEVQPMIEGQLVEVAQVAYDPDIADAYDVLRAREQDVELDWAAAGPSASSEARSFYRIPGGAAETVEMRRPPRGVIYDTHLLRMLRPNSAFLRKRVAIYYQAVKSDKAQSQAENAVRSEDFLASQKKGRKFASTRRGIAVAEKLDAEISEGASLVPFALLMTGTFEDTPEDLRRATNVLKSLMVASRMKVRRSKGLQAALFHMTLPFGILPWEFADNHFKR